MVQKYGIEGILALSDAVELSVGNPSITTNNDKEEVYIPGVEKPLKVFDAINVRIVAKMVEFRRSIILVYAAGK
jgi:hypothetical protein